MLCLRPCISMLLCIWLFSSVPSISKWPLHKIQIHRDYDIYSIDTLNVFAKTSFRLQTKLQFTEISSSPHLDHTNIHSGTIFSKSKQLPRIDHFEFALKKFLSSTAACHETLQLRKKQHQNHYMYSKLLISCYHQNTQAKDKATEIM